jgi:hypothetical protein
MRGGYEARHAVQVVYALSRWGGLRARAGRAGQPPSQPQQERQQQQDQQQEAAAPPSPAEGGPAATAGGSAAAAAAAAAAARRAGAQGALMQALFAWSAPRLARLAPFELADLLAATSRVAAAREAGGPPPAAWCGTARAAAAAVDYGALGERRAAALAKALEVLGSLEGGGGG